ncbi:MAG: DUF885 domain-containing protein [Clostridia bacterium]
MDELKSLVDEFINFQHKSNPFLATRRGDYGYETDVLELNSEQINKNISFLNDFKNKVNDLPEYKNVSDQNDKRLLLILIEDSLRELEVIKPFETNPGYYASQIMSMTHVMLTREYQGINERMNNLEMRLKKSIYYLKESKSLLTKPNYELTRQAILQAKRGGSTYFLKKVPQMIEYQNGSINKSFLKTLEQVVEAFNEHVESLEAILPIADGKFAIGEDVYNEYLKNSYLLDYTNKELIDIGNQLLNQTRMDMISLAKEIDESKTWKEIISEMKKNHPKAQDLLQTYRKELERVKEFVIENKVASVPKNEELIIIETPEHMRSLFPYAGYSRPAAFDNFQSGRFWVTPVEDEMSEEERYEKLKEHMFYKIPVFVLHEGYPGHHLQITTQQNLNNKLRKIFHNNLFVEGWAFYCEELLDRLGYISEPKTKLSRLKDQLWRASRIIIDASLHSEKMTFNQAVNFLIDNAHLERSNALAEVSRYIQNPLRPMSYLMGKLELLSIEKEYRKKHSGSYTMQTFHDRLLGIGALPPKLVKKELFDL